MTTANDISAYLVTNIPSRVTASTLGTILAYAGQEPRINQADFEARVKYERPVPVRRDTGQIRHVFGIFLTAAGWDDNAEEALSKLLGAAADQIIAAYDGRLSVFTAALAAVQVERVRCFRPSPVLNKDRRWRTLRLDFELDEMAA